MILSGRQDRGAITEKIASQGPERCVGFRRMKNNHNRMREHHELGHETESVCHVLEKAGCGQDLLEKQVGNGLFRVSDAMSKSWEFIFQAKGRHNQ